MARTSDTKAVFKREFHWTRPDGSLGFGAKPSPVPQRFPRDFITAAVTAGAAAIPDSETSDRKTPAATPRPEPLKEV
jgi:hypothetical protein